MRKIESAIKEAWQKGQALKIDNTRTDGQSVWLHGNEILRKVGSFGVEFSLAGWPTPTTKSRLRNIGGVALRQRRGRLYYLPMTGMEIEISDCSRWYRGGDVGQEYRHLIYSLRATFNDCPETYEHLQNDATPAQRLSVVGLSDCGAIEAITYGGPGMRDVIGVCSRGMFIGIEPNGYAHT